LIKICQIKLDGNDLDDDTTAMKKHKVNRYGGYTDIEWGEKTCGWVGGIERLDENKWILILRAAVEKMDLSGADEGDAVEGANGRTVRGHPVPSPPAPSTQKYIPPHCR
jgi:hypothetical protein